MSRRKTSRKRQIFPDVIYGNKLINQFINKIMKDGKKSLAQRICYSVMDNITKVSNTESLNVFNKAIKNVTPILDLRAKRIGGAIFQLPIEISKERGNSLALKFLIDSARNRPGKNIIIKLQNEIIDASNNLGGAVKKKEDIHKRAESNKTLVSLKN